MNKLLTIMILYLLLTLSQAWSLPTCLGSPQTEGSGHILWDNCVGTYTWTIGDNKGLKYVGEWKDDKRHGQGTYTSPKGDKYVGSFKDGMMHGQGTYNYANGDKYVGENKDDMMHEGTLTLATGEKYVGEFKDDKRNGQGINTWVNGNHYVGEWKDDKRHGQGTFTSPAGDKYVGSFKDDKMHGQGTYFWADGEVWQGEFKDDERVNGKKYAAGEYNSSSQVSSLPTCLGSPQTEGSGNILWDNCIGTYNWTKGDNKGLKYVGEWKDDKKHGQGTFTNPEGDKYVGEFKDDNRHGQGTSTFADGNKYVGEYKDDKIHGQGTTTFATGEKYVGEWKDAKRNGHGINIWVNGEKYVGEWKDSNRHGQGTYSFTDGRVWQGQWRNDEWVNGRKYAAGEYNPSSQVSRLPTCPGSPQTEGSGHIFWDNCIGTYTSAEDAKYVGEYKDDKMHGQGTITFVDGTKYVGGFKDDTMHGQGTITSGDGRVLQGEFKDGEWVKGKEYAAGEYNPSEKENDNKQNIDTNKIINAASGSGFIISSLGHVLTNNHVIEGCNEVKIHYNGEKYKASIIAKDDYNDIALLKANFTPSIIFSIKNGNAELLEDIYVAGYPFGDFFNSSVKITKGIVSSLSGFKNNFSNMQIDAALQPGNSGGPVIDYKGNVVGVAVAKLDLSTMIEIFDSVPENTNFAIKSSVLLNFLNANRIQTKKASEKIMARSELSETITKGTLYLSCWMTQARIEKMKTQKVLFNNIIK